MTEERKTAWIAGGVFLALALWSWGRAHPLRAQVLAAAGGSLILLGLVAPRGAKMFHLVWMKVAAILGYVNSRLLLGILYYGLFAPLGVVLRLTGRDPLNRRRKAAESYWIPRAKLQQDREQFERLF